MWEFIVRTFHCLFPPVSYGSDLESFILSRHPQSPADVEHLTQEFNQRKGNFYGTH